MTVCKRSSYGWAAFNRGSKRTAVKLHEGWFWILPFCMNLILEQDFWPNMHNGCMIGYIQSGPVNIRRLKWPKSEVRKVSIITHITWYTACFNQIRGLFCGPTCDAYLISGHVNSLETDQTKQNNNFNKSILSDPDRNHENCRNISRHTCSIPW